MASVSGNRVTFAEPIMYAEAKWGWKIRSIPIGEHVGVEDLTFEGRSKENRPPPLVGGRLALQAALNMMRLTDSWIFAASISGGVSEALSIVSSANCSAYDIAEISGNRGHWACARSPRRASSSARSARSRGQAVSPPYTSTGF